jgi:hypothetical protein
MRLYAVDECIEKEHQKQKADRRHEEILNFLGPASVTAGLGDNSFSNASDRSSMPGTFASGLTGCQWPIWMKKIKEC